MDAFQLRSELEKAHRQSYGWGLCCCARQAQQAEEVLQCVYLKVLEGKATYNGGSAFETWLFAVIRRTAAEERRKNVLRRWRLLPYRPRTAVQEQPDQAMQRSQLQEFFQRELKELPRRQQQVLQLVFYHDMSLAQAAQVLAISIGSVRTHYQRGKETLRRQLQEKLTDETRSRPTLAANVL
jgi:RNA polymerase sigma-70 factor (ECF subfamily)